MHKASRLAAAFAFIATPVLADEKACDTITQSHDWSVFHIAQKADAANNKFCLGFTSEDPRIKGVVIKVEDGSGLAIIAKEGCLDIKGDANQTLTPMVSTTDDDTIPLPPLGMGQATEVYNEMVKSCLAPNAGTISYRGKTLFPQPL